MRLTDRDIRLVKETLLSQVVARSQYVALKYFGSNSRCTDRLRVLCAASYLKALSTPYFGQYMYIAGPRAKEIAGERLISLLATRPPTPRHVQHCLAVTDVRCALVKAGAICWRFEPQVIQSFEWQRKIYQVRPDGFVERHGIPTFLEVDLCHTGLPRFSEQLQSYASFLRSGVFTQTYEAERFEVLTVTSSQTRKVRMVEAARSIGTPMTCLLFEELGVRTPGGWS